MLAMFRRRDESVLTHAQKQFGSYCYTIAYNILGNEQDAEECVNDTWLNLWNSIPPAEPESLYAFTAAVTRNLAKNRWKAAHRQRRGGGEAAIALEELLGEPAARDDVDVEELGGVDEVLPAPEAPDAEADAAVGVEDLGHGWNLPS